MLIPNYQGGRTESEWRRANKMSFSDSRNTYGYLKLQGNRKLGWKNAPHLVKDTKPQSSSEYSRCFKKIPI